MSGSTASDAFQLKGSLFTLTILQLTQVDLQPIAEHLKSTIRKAPQFFDHAPIVIDVEELGEVQQELDLLELTKLLRDSGLVPVGICGLEASLKSKAISAGLAIFPRSKIQESTPTKAKEQPATAADIEPMTTKVILQPVRSGQQVYAKNADLIIVSSVSPGAEVLADGNIHIYGSLKGRALAGIKGNKSARIFCKHLDAELLSIAGLYQLSDDFMANENRDNVQVHLENDRIKISQL